MMTQVYSIGQFRENLAEIIAWVMYAKKRVLVKKYNKKAVVLISVDDYEKLIDPASCYSQEQWEELFEPLERVAEKNKKKSSKKIATDIRQAIKEVRQGR